MGGLVLQFWGQAALTLLEAAVSVLVHVRQVTTFYSRKVWSGLAKFGLILKVIISLLLRLQEAIFMP